MSQEQYDPDVIGDMPNLPKEITDYDKFNLTMELPKSIDRSTLIAELGDLIESYKGRVGKFVNSKNQ